MPPMLPVKCNSLNLDRRRAAIALATLPAGLGCSYASYAKNPIRLILPFSAGSGIDVLARTVVDELSIALESPIAIINLPGAGGAIGAHAIAIANPDGRTLGVISDNHVILPTIVKSLPYDPIADFSVVSILATSPFVLVTQKDLTSQNLIDFRIRLEATPKSYTFGSAGNGTLPHLAAALFLESAGLPPTGHIPYRGTAALINDLLGGHVDWAVLALPAVRTHLEQGRLKALAVASLHRSESFPNIPTAVEQGFHNYLVEGWASAVGPRAVPSAVVTSIYEAFTKAFGTPQAANAISRQGSKIVLLPPDASDSFLRFELSRYAALAKRLGLVAT